MIAIGKLSHLPHPCNCFSWFIRDDKLELRLILYVGNFKLTCSKLCFDSIGDLCNPDKTKYTLEYYLQLAQQLVDLDSHVLCIKDMAGVLKPEAATLLVGALRREHPNIPIHVHTHDTSGLGVTAMAAALNAGADVVDTAMDRYNV